MVEVTQEDREAAAKVAKMQSRYAKAANMKVGNCDTSPLVQLVARHRATALAAKQAELAELRAKVEKLPDYIELFRIIRAAGRSDREKARAVFAAISPTLAETQS